MDAQLRALQASSARLRELVEQLDGTQLETPAYPSEWTIADVLSHLGSGAVIFQRRLDDALADQPTPDDYPPTVWDVWNAKAPKEKVADALEADRALVDRVAAMTAEERDNFALPLGPLKLDATQFVATRLNEHTLHSWDVAIALDDSAALPPEAIPLVVDNLELIGNFTARADGSERQIRIHTDDPERNFTVTLMRDKVTFGPGEAAAAPDLTMPAEALIRLVYGRLDPAHTPAVAGDGATLDQLRHVFPGP
jgi:uncharacterized protein (TIGR03083 family)